VVSSFLQNEEGWTAVGDGNLFYAPAGGNPPSTGYIFIIDRVEGDNFYFQAPRKFHGNFSAAYGRRLEFDLVWSETAPSQPKAGDDIILEGGGLAIVSMLPSYPGMTWTSYSVPLNEAGGWLLRHTPPPATAAQIQSVLASVTRLRIRGEFREGPEQGSLDNVRFGAEP
jgi:hypothetical protein